MTRSGHRRAARAVATVAALGLALPVAGASAAYAGSDWHGPKPEPGWDVSDPQGSEWHRKKPVAPNDDPVWTVASGPKGDPTWGLTSGPKGDPTWGLTSGPKGDPTWGLTSASQGDNRDNTGPDEEPGWD